MLQPLDGPSKQFILATVTTTTPVEVKAGAASFPERKIITLQADSKFYIYFADEGETPTAGDIASKGFIQYKNAKKVIKMQIKMKNAMWKFKEIYNKNKMLLQLS